MEGKLARAKVGQSDYMKSFREWARSGDPGLYGPFEALNKSKLGGSSIPFGEVAIWRRSGEFLREELERFENKSGTKLWWYGEGSGFSDKPDQRLRNKTPEQRFQIAQTAAELFYEVQLKILKERLDDARSRRPEWGIKIMKLPRQVATVPLCDICGALMGGLRPVEAEEDDLGDDDSNGGDEGYADDYAEPDAGD